MKTPPRSNGLVELPDHWTAAEASAVVDLLNLLLDAVCLRYQQELQDLAREDYLHDGTARSNDDLDDF